MKKITKSLWSELLGTLSILIVLIGTSVKMYSKVDKIEDKQVETNTRLNHISDSLGFVYKQVLQTKKESFATTTIIKESDPQLAKKIDNLILKLDQFGVIYEKKNNLTGSIQ